MPYPSSNNSPHPSNPYPQEPQAEPAPSQGPSKLRRRMGWGVALIAGIFTLAIWVGVEPTDENMAEAAGDGTGLQLGETFTTRDALAITVEPAYPVSETLGTYTCTDISLVNNGDEQIAFSGHWDWKMQNPAGVILEPAYTGKNTLKYGDLAPGGHVSGTVCFEGHTGGEHTFIYDPALNPSYETATWTESW